VTLAELLVIPIRESRPELARQYQDLLLGQPHFSLIPVERDVAERAAYIRATYKFKMPDAICLASALAHAADVFVTNDAKLRGFPELPVVVLKDHTRLA
jgi:predicted nucleic acid-binding protein